jgi:hypothetical protein
MSFACFVLVKTTVYSENLSETSFLLVLILQQLLLPEEVSRLLHLNATEPLHFHLIRSECCCFPNESNWCTVLTYWQSSRLWSGQTAVKCKSTWRDSLWQLFRTPSQLCDWKLELGNIQPWICSLALNSLYEYQAKSLRKWHLFYRFKDTVLIFIRKLWA